MIFYCGLFGGCCRRPSKREQNEQQMILLELVCLLTWFWFLPLLITMYSGEILPGLGISPPKEAAKKKSR
jgi:hypothetical protein